MVVFTTTAAAAAGGGAHDPNLSQTRGDECSNCFVANLNIFTPMYHDIAAYQAPPSPIFLSPYIARQVHRGGCGGARWPSHSPAFERLGGLDGERHQNPADVHYGAACEGQWCATCPPTMFSCVPLKKKIFHEFEGK